MTNTQIIIVVAIMVVCLVCYLLSKKGKRLFKKKELFRKIPAENNWDGVPKPGLTWDEVRKGTEKIRPIIPMTLEVDPTECPVCGGPLEKYESDWCDIEENSGQYAVIGLYCNKGHWTNLDWM